MKNISLKKNVLDLVNTQASIFRALASPIRLAIVSLLYEQERPVNKIVEALAEMRIPKTEDRTNVCKNLALLKKMSIVTSRKHHQQRIYMLQARCLLDAVNCTLDVIALKKKLEE